MGKEKNVFSASRLTLGEGARRQYNTQKSRLASHLRFLFLEFHPRILPPIFALFNPGPFSFSTALALVASASPSSSTRLPPFSFRSSSSRQLGYTPWKSITCILFVMKGSQFPLSPSRHPRLFTGYLGEISWRSTDRSFPS